LFPLGGLMAAAAACQRELDQQRKSRFFTHLSQGSLPEMIGTDSKVVECRELVRRMAANLAHRAGRMPPPELVLDGCGQTGVSVGGSFRKLESCDDPGSITPGDYETRIFDFFGCGRDVYVIALTYLDRLFQKHPEFVLSHGDVNRLLLTSITLALKWHEEVCDQYPDEHYAIVGGVTIEEFRSLESRFLALLGWELHVNPVDFCKHCFLTAALRTKATQFGNAASSCSTSPGSSPADSEDEEIEEEDEDNTTEVWSDDSDDGECLPGRPLWGTCSFKKYANDLQYGEEDEEEDDDEGLPDWAPWSEQSFEENDGLPSWTMCSKQSTEEEDDEDGLPGWAPWSDNSFQDRHTIAQSDMAHAT